jgi:thioesterase domain-containing protein
MAAKLEAGGDTVAILVLLESIPPLSRGAAADRENTNEQDRPEGVSSETEKALYLTFEEIRRQLGLLPPEIAQRFGQFCREQIRMSFGYRASPINAAIALLRTPVHPDVVFQGWKHFSTNFVEHVVPGETFSMLSPPHVTILGARLDKVLANALS